MSRYRGKWRAFLIAAMNLRLPYNSDNVLKTRGIAGFPRRAMLHAISYTRQFSRSYSMNGGAKSHKYWMSIATFKWQRSGRHPFRICTNERVRDTVHLISEWPRVGNLSPWMHRHFRLNNCTIGTAIHPKVSANTRQCEALLKLNFSLS